MVDVVFYKQAYCPLLSKSIGEYILVLLHPTSLFFYHKSVANNHYSRLNYYLCKATLKTQKG